MFWVSVCLTSAPYTPSAVPRCPRLHHLHHGHYADGRCTHLSDLAAGQRCRAACRHDYRLHGTSLLTCGSDGEWSPAGHEPHCAGTTPHGTVAINERINQSASQSINQSINQSIDQPINKSTNKSINQSVKQSINRLIN